MSKVIYNMSMSLDGFVRARDWSEEEPLGKGGDRLHDWFFSDDPDARSFAENTLDRLGAIVTGRATYDHSKWSGNGPSGELRVPTFVVTHQPPAEVPDCSVFTFVEGIGPAVAAARAAAGGKMVSVMGGPNIGCQALSEGLVHEVLVSVVPILFGGGLPMFSNLGPGVELEHVSCVDTPSATHITYRVVGNRLAG